MTFDLFMDEHQLQALVACLAASLLWAPIILATARVLGEGASIRTGQAIWIGALMLSVTPTALAPGLAGVGLTLRPTITESAEVIAPPTIDERTFFAASEFEPSTETVVSAPNNSEFAAPADRQWEVEEAGIEALPEASSFVVATTTQDASADATQAELFFPIASDWRLDGSLVAQAVSAATILYIYGALLAALIWMVRTAGLHLVASSARPVTDQTIIRGMEDWRAKLGVARAPRLKRSRRVSSVCVFGVWRPTVLIPHDIETRVSQEDIVMMCAHELAHIRRRDTQLFFATALVRVLFWFNPWIKTIAAHVEQAAEEAADAQVLKRGVDRKAYASCFVASLRFAADKAARRPAMTPTFIPIDREGRRRRLDAILHEKHRKSAPFAARSLAAGVALAMGVAAVAQAGFAVSPSSVENRPAFVAGLTDLFTAETESPLAPEAPVNVAVVEDLDIAPPTPEAAPEPPAAVDAAPPVSQPVELVAPAQGRLTAGFGIETPIGVGDHKGIDIAARKGDPVLAARAGVVILADERGRSAYGKVVKIDHGEGVYTKYAHLSRIDVAKGDWVAAGEQIAAIGNSGQSTGPHLHFEYYRNGARIDPMTAFSKPEAAKFGSRPAISPAAPRLKTSALKDDAAIAAVRGNRKPVRLAFSMSAGASPAIAELGKQSLRLDAAGGNVSKQLELSLLQDASRAAGVVENREPSTSDARSQFARMEAELADARARRASAKARRNAESKMAQAKAEAARQKASVAALSKQGKQQALSAAEEARRRAAEERQRAADRRQQIADERQRAADEIQRAADERQRKADERQRKADERQRRADERQRWADERQRWAEERQREAVARAEARAEAHADRLRGSLEGHFCCGDVTDIETVIESSLEEALGAIDDIDLGDVSLDVSAKAAEISERAIEAARAALAGDDHAEALAAAEAKIADQEAEIARLRAELAAAARNPKN